MEEGIVLKPGKEVVVERRHPWIFSGAVARLPDGDDGGLCPVADARGKVLGWGYFNRRSNIVGRMLSWDATAEPATLVADLLERAVSWRAAVMSPATTAYRLVNAEGDSLPGLTVDLYGDVVVIQVQTLGIERCKGEVVSWLAAKLQPRGIYEKSMGTARRQEGLADSVGVVYGDVADAVVVREYGLSFEVAIREGQKTGLFLDQREMRRRVGELAAGRRVLNCFSYSGGFSLYAHAGGASWVESVDISARAISWADRNYALNGGSGSDVDGGGGSGGDQRWHAQVADVFTFLRDAPLDYDLVILDPPSFAKRQREATAACRGYRQLNRLALAKMRPDTLLLTCSCSQPVSEELFREQLFLAALDAGRYVQVVERLRHSPDHPVSLFHPEGNYLKGFLLHVS